MAKRRPRKMKALELIFFVDEKYKLSGADGGEQNIDLCFQPPLMDFEQVLNLFDSFWFEREIFNKHPLSSNPQNPQPENQDRKPLPEEPFMVPRLRTRSISEDLSSKLSFMSNSNSPDSVLFSPKLQTIFSSKDIAGADSLEISRKLEIERRPKTESRRRLRGRRMKRSESRSLSELEFEELKGFMDLGFVFSEEDKGSSLASIVPGLNRLGKKEEEEEEEGFGDPFHQILEFPDWMNNGNESCFQEQLLNDYQFFHHDHPSALPCMDIGEFEGMDGEWLA